MILGNSHGNNYGKKYLKITGNESVTIEGQLRYDLFSSWFSINYIVIERQLVLKGILDHEMLNNTFVKISNIVLYRSLPIDDFMSYFMRSYYTNFMSASLGKTNQTSLDEYGQFLLNPEDRRLDFEEIYFYVNKYVTSRYKEVDCKIFFAYFSNKEDKSNFRNLASKFNVSTFTIHKIINTILKDIRKCSVLKQLYQDIQ